MPDDRPPRFGDLLDNRAKFEDEQRSRIIRLTDVRRRAWIERTAVAKEARVMSYRTNDKGKQIRGFAAMTPEQQRELASRGGKASHGGGRKPGSVNARKVAEPSS